MANTNVRNFTVGVLILASIIVIGTYAFSLIEGVDLFDSLYYVILIITTVGMPYEVATFYGKILIMVLLALGIGLVLYIAIFVAGAVIEGQTISLLGGIKEVWLE